MMLTFDTRTGEERRKGRFQSYVHAGPWIHQYSGRNNLPADFRHHKPVRRVSGGRWYVRKLAKSTKDGWQWHAYNKGSFKGASSRFPTQRDAILYAQKMATLAAEVTR